VGEWSNQKKSKKETQKKHKKTQKKTPKKHDLQPSQTVRDVSSECCMWSEAMVCLSSAAPKILLQQAKGNNLHTGWRVAGLVNLRGLQGLRASPLCV
jgi:hypothetical protein